MVHARVNYTGKQPSSKVAIIRFERGMQQGLLTRIGRGSIMEYHAFGIISYASSCKMRPILIVFLLEKGNMPRNIFSSAVSKEILLGHS